MILTYFMIQVFPGSILNTECWVVTLQSNNDVI